MIHGSSCLFFMKTHLLALLQDNCLHLVRCAFLRKLSGCVRDITAFCQHLLRPMPIKSAILADTDISAKRKYQSIISARPIYRSTSSLNSSLAQSTSELWSCKDLANMGKLYLFKRNAVGSKGVKKQYFIPGFF